MGREKGKRMMRKTPSSAKSSLKARYEEVIPSYTEKQGVLFLGEKSLFLD